MNCYIKIDSTNKAKQDIDTLMAGMGFRNIAVRGVGGRKAETFLRKVFSLVHSLFVLKKGDVLVMQYPYKKFYALQCRAARFKGAHTITLIHDLGTFRRRKLTAPQEMRRLSHTDYIIAHNDRMKQWLVEHGRDGSTVGTLGIFDYLSPSQGSGVPSVSPSETDNREKRKEKRESQSSLPFGEGWERLLCRAWRGQSAPSSTPADCGRRKMPSSMMPAMSWRAA